MPYLLKIAYLNIIRHKRRSALTFLVLSFGVMIYIFVSSFLEGFNRQSIESMISYETGHMKVRNSAYDEEEPFTFSTFLGDYDGAAKTASALPFVKAVSPRIIFPGEADNGTDSLNCMIYGINIGAEDGVFSFRKFIISGNLAPGGALIGKGLAEDLGLKAGDQIYLTFRTGQGMLDSVELEITGLLYAPSLVVNNSGVYMNLGEAMRLLNTGAVTELALRTDDFTKHKEYKKNLAAALPGLSVKSWDDLQGNVAALVETKGKFANVFVLLIVIIAIVGITNTVLMSVLEKRREIGTLKAMGMTDREIEGLFLAEGLMIGVFGCILGVILGEALNAYFVIKGMDFMKFFKDSNSNMGINLIGPAKSVWAMAPVIRSFIICILASLLSSYIPAKKTLKLQAAEALRVSQ